MPHTKGSTTPKDDCLNYDIWTKWPHSNKIYCTKKVLLLQKMIVMAMTKITDTKSECQCSRFGDYNDPITVPAPANI